MNSMANIVSYFIFLHLDKKVQFSRQYSKFQSLIFCFNFEPKCAGHCVLARGIRLLGVVRKLFLEPQPEHQCLNSTDNCPYLCLTKEIKGTDLCIEILFFLCGCVYL